MIGYGSQYYPDNNNNNNTCLSLSFPCLKLPWIINSSNCLLLFSLKALQPRLELAKPAYFIRSLIHL